MAILDLTFTLESVRHVSSDLASDRVRRAGHRFVRFGRVGGALGGLRAVVKPLWIGLEMRALATCHKCVSP